MAKSVLVVEDDKQLQDLYSGILIDEQFSVQTALDGVEALEKIKTFPPDLILLDLLLPNVSGFDILKTLKEDEGTRNIKVIVLTNIFADKLDLIKNGADRVLLKAENAPDQIIHEIRSVLNLQK